MTEMFSRFPPQIMKIVQEEIERCAQPMSLKILADETYQKTSPQLWLRWRIWARIRNEVTFGYAGNRKRYTLERIGNLWGVNHATVMHGIRRVMYQPKANPYMTPYFDFHADFPLTAPSKEELKSIKV